MGMNTYILGMTTQGHLLPRCGVHAGTFSVL